jgi:ketosteroid isomerase-like protein
MPDEATLTPGAFMEAVRAGDVVRALRAGYAAFNERRLDMRIFHPEAEWHQRPQLPDARTHRGREEISRLNDEFIGSFDDFRVEPREMFGTSGKVVAVVDVNGRVRGSAQRVAMEEVHVWSFRDGMASEVREYLTKDEALEAIGLEE